ncbi:hypothetical protein ACFX13_009272 [Malus domestica]
MRGEPKTVKCKLQSDLRFSQSRYRFSPELFQTNQYPPSYTERAVRYKTGFSHKTSSRKRRRLLPVLCNLASLVALFSIAASPPRPAHSALPLPVVPQSHSSQRTRSSSSSSSSIEYTGAKCLV